MLATASTSTILQAWLRTTAGDLVEEPDEFRNPVGHAFREALPVLLEVALGRLPMERAAGPLERLMRIRAVQDLKPSEAAGFLFELYPLLRDFVPTAALQERVSRMAMDAFDSYMACREQAHAIRIKELRRNGVRV